MSFIGARISVDGAVQGVGFRYWCLRTAREIGVNGYVANLPDGSVEIEAEGERGLIEEFLKAVKVGPTYAHISDMKIEWYEKPRGYRDFGIRYKD